MSAPRLTRSATGDTCFDVRRDCYFCGQCDGDLTKSVFVDHTALMDKCVSRASDIEGDTWGDAVMRRCNGLDFVVCARARTPACARRELMIAKHDARALGP